MTPMPLVTAPVGVSARKRSDCCAPTRSKSFRSWDDEGRLRGLITVKDFDEKRETERHQGR